METEQVNRSNQEEAVTPVTGETGPIATEKSITETTVESDAMQTSEQPSSVTAADASLAAADISVAAADANESTAVPEVEMTESVSETDKSTTEQPSEQSTPQETVAIEPKEEQSTVEESPMEESAVESAPTVDTFVKVDESSVPSAVSTEESALEKLVEPKVEKENDIITVTPQTVTTNGVKADAPVAQATAAQTSAVKKPKIDLATMAVRQYLDHTVVPILLSGLAAVAKARPEDPIEFLGHYLLENKSKYDNNQENSSINGNQ